MLAGSHGMLLTFSATAAPLLSGTARGNCSMKLPDGASVVSLAVLSENVASSMHSRLSAVSDDSEDVGGSDEAGGHADGDGSTALLLVWASGAAKRISTSELRLNKSCRGSGVLSSRFSLEDDALVCAQLCGGPDDHVYVDMGGQDALELRAKHIPMKKRGHTRATVETIQLEAAGTNRRGRRAPQKITPGQSVRKALLIPSSDEPLTG